MLSKVAVGDHSAFKTLYEETKNMVYFYALEITRNHSTAEDVMQETFVTIWTKSNTFLDRGSGKSWIISITKNIAINTMRRTKPSISIDALNNYLTDNDDMLKNIEDNVLLNQMFLVLNKKEQSIIILRVLSGFTLTEIAQHMEMKKNTVFWLYYNSLKKLNVAYERMVRDDEKFKTRNIQPSRKTNS